MERPRVLVVVTSTGSGGAQTFVEELVTGLADTYEFHIAAYGSGGGIQDTCTSHDIPFHHVGHLRRDVSWLRDTAALYQLRRVIERVRPAIVQLNSSKAGALGRVASVFSGVPVVFTAHGWAFAATGRSSAVWALAERSLARLTAAIVCVSRYDRELALARGVGDEGRIHVIHNGVRVPESPPSRGEWPDEPRLACIARLAPQKDVPLLLEAIAENGNEGWQIDVFGDGPDRLAVERRVVDLGLAGRVRLRGDKENVTTILSEYDALALPSNWEGFPFSVLEAMAAGLPVVASDVGGVSEAVVDGETGLLVPRGDVAGFAEALRSLRNDPRRARAFGIAGHARVRGQFRLSTMLERYDALFSSLCEADAHIHTDRVTDVAA